MFEAVTVYVVEAETPLGVPDTAPVLVLNVSPAGRPGDTEYAVTHCDTVGAAMLAATPTVKLNVLAEYASEVGAAVSQTQERGNDQVQTVTMMRMRKRHDLVPQQALPKQTNKQNTK